MKYFKVLAILLLLIIILGCIFIKNNIMISESSYVANANLDDIIGYISIDNINLGRVLVQGYDNSFYLNHNYYKGLNTYGEIFLDYEGDLLNEVNPIIYTNINNLDYDNLNIDDIVKISYLNNDLCYKVTSNKLDSNLLIKLIDNNLEINVLCKKIMC